MSIKFLTLIFISLIIFQGCTSSGHTKPTEKINNTYTSRSVEINPLPKYQDCNQLVIKSYDYGTQANTKEEKKILEKALQQCPNNAIAHNNLASILEDETKYYQAVNHYKQALKIKPNFSEAWYGLGETYYKQGQFPLSLEAHLNACKSDPDSQKRVKELLKDNRYAVTEQGRILNKQSLLLLFDKQQRKKINSLIAACGLRTLVGSKATFSNITFKTGSDMLTQAAKQQIYNIAEAFKQTMPSVIKLHGHTDTQTFQGITDPIENDRLNLQLSEQRAEAVKTELAARGINERGIQAQGYGSKQPLVRGISRAAYAQNRRVEIESVD